MNRLVRYGEYQTSTFPKDLSDVVIVEVPSRDSIELLLTALNPTLEWSVDDVIHSVDYASVGGEIKDSDFPILMYFPNNSGSWVVWRPSEEAIGESLNPIPSRVKSKKDVLGGISYNIELSKHLKKSETYYLYKPEEVDAVEKFLTRISEVGIGSPSDNNCLVKKGDSYSLINTEYIKPTGRKVHTLSELVKTSYIEVGWDNRRFYEGV